MDETPELWLYDGKIPQAYAVRLFVIERRGGYRVKALEIDVNTLENRMAPYLQINSRAELPALQIDETFVLTEVPAILEYLDEISVRGPSLFGSNAIERAETRMWLHRMDLEIIVPVFSWWKNKPATIDLNFGNYIPIPEAETIQKVRINHALDRLNQDLEGKEWLCGDRFSAADIHFYGLTRSIISVSAEWDLMPGRKNIVSYLKRMDDRPASLEASILFSQHQEVRY